KRIEASSIVFVLVGKTFQDCEWVDWEVRESLRMKKNLVALRLNDEPSLKAPKVLRDHRIKLLPSGEEIRDLIRKNASDR
ncbi:MAG: TIR domain-containing protein, partial [Methanothrix sp.]|nr:TIR domain-containing protein [Methanothrix sp.]